MDGNNNQGTSMYHYGDGDNVAGDKIVYFNDILYHKDPQREYLSLREPLLLNSFFDRTAYVNGIRNLFLEGASIVVIHGSPGLGKSALANTYYHQFKEEYKQNGWVSYHLNICKSIVQAFDSHYTEVNGRKNDVLYEQLGFSEIIYLRNNPQKRLIILDDVSDWEDIQEHFDLFQIKDTHFLFTSPVPCPEEALKNFGLNVASFPVPELDKKLIKEIFDHSLSTTLPPAVTDKLTSNLYLLNVILQQVSSKNPKAIRDYFEAVFSGLDGEKKQEIKILGNVFDLASLTNPETWVLLQMAALPSGNYDVDDLSDFIAPDTTDNPVDLTDLKGFNAFKDAYPSATTSTNYELVNILPSLIEKGWLVAVEDDQFNLNPLLQTTLKNKVRIDVDYFYELSECLSNAFFTELYDLLVDDLKYEQHLRSFLSFVPAQAKELYLENFEKLILLTERNGHYYEELSMREQHLQLLRKSSKAENIRMIQSLIDMADCLRRYGRAIDALAYAKEALSIGESMVSYDLSSCYTILGLILQALGDYEGAKKLLEKAKISDEKNFGIHHPTTAFSYSNLATVLKDLEDYQGAKVYLEKAKMSVEKNFGIHHPKTAVCYSNLALVLKELEDYQGAKELLEKAKISDEKNFGIHHPTTAVNYSNLALVLKELGDYQGAKGLLENAKISAEKNFGIHHPSAAVSYSNLAFILQDLGDYQGAKGLLEKALEIFQNTLPEGHPYLKNIEQGLQLLNEK